MAYSLEIEGLVRRIHELDAALRQCLAHIEVDEAAHGRPFAAGNVARAALGHDKPEPDWNAAMAAGVSGTL